MKKFSVSIWVRDGDVSILPVGSVEEADAFLEGWPSAGRSPLYYAAADSIKAAKAGSVIPDMVANALMEFLREEGALAEERLII